jgi:hypothetical protein
MPTLNLGRVRFNWKGAYAQGIAYVAYDAVEDDGQSYVCIAPITGTGPNDSGGSTYWSPMLVRSADYNQARQEAIDAAAAAGDSASSASGDASAAGSSAIASADSEALAEKWASEAEDVEVETGKFSAFHYMNKAAAFGDPNQFNITADQTLDTRTTAEWMAALLAAQQKANDNTSDISTNTSDISTNTSDISTNTSDILERAELSGGPLANFTAMPQVGGDPIVESGSNADGGWTRWADGSQICIGASSSGGDTWKTSPFHQINFPVSFISGSASIHEGDGYSLSLQFGTDDGLYTTSAVVDYTYNRTHSFRVRPQLGFTDSGTSIKFGFIAIGRWK